MSDERALSRRNWAAVLIGALACFQMVGHFIGSLPMRGIGAATTIAPYTKVFSDVDGYEPFASEFTLRYRDAGGTLVETNITPALASRFGGPYNRRKSTVQRCRMRRDCPLRCGNRCFVMAW